MFVPIGTINKEFVTIQPLRHQGTKIKVIILLIPFLMRGTLKLINYFSCNAFFLFRLGGKIHIYSLCLGALVAT